MIKCILSLRKRGLIEYVERYRSGHNEAVLKTVCPRGRVGSNPTLSALKKRSRKFRKGVSGSLLYIFVINVSNE